MEPAAASYGAVGAAGAAGGVGAGTRDGGQRAASAIVDDRLYVFEAVGLLLGQEEVAAEEQQQLLSALLQPLREQVGRARRAEGGRQEWLLGDEASVGCSAGGHVLQLLWASVRERIQEDSTNCSLQPALTADPSFLLLSLLLVSEYPFLVVTPSLLLAAPPHLLPACACLLLCRRSRATSHCAARRHRGSSCRLWRQWCASTRASAQTCAHAHGRSSVSRRLLAVASSRASLPRYTGTAAC